MFGLQDTRSTSLPLPRQSVRVPPILMRNRGEQGNRKGVVVEPLQDGADQIRLLSPLAYGIEDVSCGIHRQRWDVDNLAFGRNHGDPGRDTETYRLHSAQLYHKGVDLHRVRSSGIEDRFGVVEDYDRLPRR